MPIECAVAIAIIPAPAFGAIFVEAVASFNSPVIRILGTALKDYDLAFVGGDHHLQIVRVVPFDGIQISPTDVRVLFSIALADENFDKVYTGSATALVIAEVA